MSWPSIRESSVEKFGKKADKDISFYLDKIKKWNIPAGRTGDHLQSYLIFSSREVMEKTGGFKLGADYSEAVAAEVAFSRQVEALGYRIATVESEPFGVIGHLQWDPSLDTWRAKIYRKLRRFARLVRAWLQK